MITEVFTSQIDPSYQIRCWKGKRDVAYAFQTKAETTPGGIPTITALPPCECPPDVVAELHPLAREFLGVTF